MNVSYYTRYFATNVGLLEMSEFSAWKQWKLIARQNVLN